jgi:TRAP-type mannitol/chloroaromatic compound transport system permease small subunit
MIAAIRRAADVIDRLNRAIGQAAMWLCLVIAVVEFGVIVARYGFSAGSIAVQEAVQMAQAALYLLTAAWTLQAGQHVRVDIFYQAASPRRRAAIDLAGAVLFLLPFATMLLWVSLPYVARSVAILEHSREAGGLPAVYLFKSLIPLFAALIALQGVAQAIRAGLALTGADQRVAA